MKVWKVYDFSGSIDLEELIEIIVTFYDLEVNIGLFKNNFNV